MLAQNGGFKNMPMSEIQYVCMCVCVCVCGETRDKLKKRILLTRLHVQRQTITTMQTKRCTETRGELLI